MSILSYLYKVSISVSMCECRVQFFKIINGYMQNENSNHRLPPFANILHPRCSGRRSSLFFLYRNNTNLLLKVTD